MEASKKKGVAMKKTNDHWAFLEHIEAPMWVDLTVEAVSGGVDTGGDDWFNKSHPFHQMSARELKSKFSQGDEILAPGIDLQGVNSPELPSSVSRSRGKHYNKKWEGINLNTLLDNQTSRRGLQQYSSFGQVKPRLKSNVIRPKRALSGKFGLTFEPQARGKTVSKVSCSKTVGSSSSDRKTGGSSPRSTITSDNTQKYTEVSSKPCDQKRSSSIRRVSVGKCVTRKVSNIQPQKKCLGVSSQPCDQNSRSSSIISVRRSYVSVKTSKVEIGDNSTQSRGSKSSSGKSSVGSCSDTSVEAKFVSRQHREKITYQKGGVTIKRAIKNSCKPGETSKATKSGNRMGNNINFSKPAYHRTAKSLVQYPSTSSKASLQHIVNKKNSCMDGAKEKLRTTKVSSLTAKGKENITKNVTVNRKCIARGVSAGGPC
ncbi:uncharacterized protein LOC106755777 isoform X1 [Vigna radiata var. radiata]|uniref:Uncharacterized protein LOC106755777 isoform X1 n=1 Tax=Vigna radiata var. radiata TaxID=3916 RepID=A0A3Q0ERQ4_VIGRR|nr:uncharacterized protein LOC106755777 isoform X1 [Vigna radiata var. radiata]